MPRKCSGTKGYQCGRSCISVKYVCRKDGLSGQSVNIANRLAQLIQQTTRSEPISKAAAKSKPKPKPWKIERDEFGVQVDSKLDGHDLTVLFSGFGPDLYAVNFEVNDDYDVDTNIDTATRKRIGLRMLKMIDAGFNEFKDGAKFQAEAYMGDGKGNAREKLYKKYGFSEPDSVSQMRAIKKDGKLQPPTEEELIELFSEEDDAEMLALMIEILFD